MNIKEIKQAKILLTQEIGDAIYTFETNTTCKVQEIELVHRERMGRDEISITTHVIVKVKV